MTSGFWSMGGYARYVWPCFGFAGLVLGWNLWAARRLRCLRSTTALILGRQAIGWTAP